MRKRIAIRVERPEFVHLALAVALTAALLVTLLLLAWREALVGAENEARNRFAVRMHQITEVARGRLQDQALLLRGAAGFLAAAGRIDQRGWQDYVRGIDLRDSHPGVLALGAAVRVTRADRAAHERELRSQGLSGAAIAPADPDRDEYYPVRFVAPAASAGGQTPGSDLGADAAERRAIAAARDSGQPALGRPPPPATAGEPDRHEYLMYLPVYRVGMPLESVAERRAALHAVVYARLSARALFELAAPVAQGVRLAAADGTAFDPRKVVYDAAPQLPGAARAPRFVEEAGLALYDWAWTLRFESLPEFERTIDTRMPRVILVGGSLTTFMLLVIMWSLATLRVRAAELARRMTRELSQSAERLTLALEGSNLALFDWDTQTGQVHLSDTWSRFIGSPPGETRTTIAELEQLVHPEDMPRVRRELRRMLSGECAFYEVEHRVRRTNGEWTWILSRAKAAERDPRGAVLRVTGTNADITDRKALERLKDEFIASVSHDMRTPLTAVIGALGLLKEESASALRPVMRNFLEIAFDNAERLAALVNDILDFERLQSGRAVLHMQRVALDAFLDAAIRRNTPYADQYSVALELADPVPAVDVQADPDRLDQVLANLISNAVKFSPRNGKVTIVAAARDGVVRISVADRGPGVPPEIGGRVFERFVQAGSAERARKRGTGLGLSICKTLVEQMGGTIGFTSTPGEGATFFFELPLPERRP